MGYCSTCSEWTGYSTTVCELEECIVVRKLVGLYGIKKVCECLNKVFIREDKAVENRTKNVDKIEPTNLMSSLFKKEYGTRENGMKLREVK